MNLVKRLKSLFILILIILLVSDISSFAQLKKVAEIEKIKSFTNGSVVLNRTLLDGVEIYSVTLPNNSKNHDPIVLFWGNMEEMNKNLHDLSDALDIGKNGKVFNFSACGKDYQLSFSKTLGQKCFKVWEPINISSDFGRFYKATIDDILKFISKESKEN